jgi:hypothetical protein
LAAEERDVQKRESPRWLLRTTTAVSAAIPLLNGASLLLKAWGATTWANIIQVAANILISAAAVLLRRSGS